MAVDDRLSLMPDPHAIHLPASGFPVALGDAFQFSAYPLVDENIFLVKSTTLFQILRDLSTSHSTQFQPLKILPPDSGNGCRRYPLLRASLQIRKARVVPILVMIIEICPYGPDISSG